MEGTEERYKYLAGGENIPVPGRTESVSQVSKAWDSFSRDVICNTFKRIDYNNESVTFPNRPHPCTPFDNISKGSFDDENLENFLDVMQRFDMMTIRKDTAPMN